MNQEIIFAKALEDVRRLAKEQGNCISEEQVRDRFSQLAFSREQLEMVLDYLKKHNIGIGEPIEAEELLTDEERNYLQDYLDEIALLPVYTDGQREACAMAAMAGDAAARQRLTESCLKDVADIAKLYAGQGVALEDLIGEGNVALATAVEMLARSGKAGGGEPLLGKPSEAQGLLARRIMDAMEECIREHAANEKTDRKIAHKVNHVADKARELAEELHRKVTPEELKEETGLSLKAIQDAMRRSVYQIEDLDAAEQDSPA